MTPVTRPGLADQVILVPDGEALISMSLASSGIDRVRRPATTQLLLPAGLPSPLASRLSWHPATGPGCPRSEAATGAILRLSVTVATAAARRPANDPASGSSSANSGPSASINRAPDFGLPVDGQAHAIILAQESESAGSGFGAIAQQREFDGQGLA